MALDSFGSVAVLSRWKIPFFKKVKKYLYSEVKFKNFQKGVQEDIFWKYTPNY